MLEQLADYVVVHTHLPLASASIAPVDVILAGRRTGQDTTYPGLAEAHPDTSGHRPGSASHRQGPKSPPAQRKPRSRTRRRSCGGHAGFGRHRSNPDRAIAAESNARRPAPGSEPGGHPAVLINNGGRERLSEPAIETTRLTGPRIQLELAGQGDPSAHREHWSRDESRPLACPRRSSSSKVRELVIA